MAISTSKLLMILGTSLASVLIIGFMLLSSIVPQFSVFELFMQNDPIALRDKKVQIVGDVAQIDDGSFVLRDWETKNLNISVFHTNLPIPSGFGLDKRVLVEGTLKQDADGHWFIDAELISTKCPSKYETTSP